MTSQRADSSPARQSHNELVEEHIPLARRIAGRYIGRGEPLEDLVQVAMLGLVKAAQRYEPERGTDFPRYAVPTIMGELRRHFRDSCWAVRVPRGLQELSLRVQGANEQLCGELGRSPTVHEVADLLDVSADEILEALDASSAYSAMSLDSPVLRHQPDGPTVAERLSADESSIDDVEANESVRGVLAQLPARERRMLTLRYFGERTQREIAEELSISQMHVSRLLTRTLTRLRDYLVDDIDLPDDWHDHESGRTVGPPSQPDGPAVRRSPAERASATRTDPAVTWTDSAVSGRMANLGAQPVRTQPSVGG